MAKQNKVKLKVVNCTTNHIINKVVPEVRFCPKCNNVLLHGQYVCEKCGGYYLDGFTNIKEE